MEIDSLFTEYVQKSKLFLYPALDIERGGSVTPIETYTSWKDYYSTKDCKLICLYHLRDDIEFKNFEKVVLLNHPKFCDFKQVESETGNDGVYVFDFINHKDDWDNFLVGRYSELSDSHKKKIQKFFSNAGTNYPYIESYLYPEKYYATYAKILAEKKDRKEMEGHLRYANELCDKPVWELEELKVTIKDLVMSK